MTAPLTRFAITAVGLLFARSTAWHFGAFTASQVQTIQENVNIHDDNSEYTQKIVITVWAKTAENPWAVGTCVQLNVATLPFQSQLGRRRTVHMELAAGISTQLSTPIFIPPW